MSKGLFITFEGIDGCGKSTQLTKAKEYLAAKGQELVVTREPGGTPIAEKIRELVLSNENSEMDDHTELLLYLAARAQHVAEKIRPAVDDGKVVLCDRFQEATFAYQGFGRGLCHDSLKALNKFATNGMVPDRTYVFDLSVEAAYERLRLMNKAPDRLESGSSDFHQRIREGYLTLASGHPDRIMLLAAEKSIEELAKTVCADLDTLLATEDPS